MEKAEVVDEIFALVLTYKWSSHAVWVTEGKGGFWGNVELSTVGGQLQSTGPYWPEGYDPPQDVALINKSWGKKEKKGSSELCDLSS